MRKDFCIRSHVQAQVATGVKSWGRRVIDYCWRWPPPMALRWGGGGVAGVLVILLFWPWILGAAIGMGLYHLWDRMKRK